MKLRILLASAAALAIVAAEPAGLLSSMGNPGAVVAQEARVSFNLFFDDLGPHGLWVRHERYQYVFCPRVDARWRPYTEGRWRYLRDRGWYFDSDEPFAWAVYHYGRWVDDDRLGWCWVPGTKWAPAWVSWRRGDGYIGWAPLPPENDGFQISIEVNVGEPPEDDWVFIPVRSFVEPQLSVSIVFSDDDPDIYRRTEYAGPVIIQNNVVINNVIDIDIIQQETNTEVEVVDVASVDDPAEAGAETQPGTIEVFDPDVEEPEPEAAPPEAVEPEQAAEELPAAQEQPAEGEATDAPADEVEADNPDATPADPAEAPTECAEGEEMVDGQCVPIAADEAPAEAPAPDTAEEPAAPAEGAAPAQAEPEAAPAEEVTEDAPAPETCPEGTELVEGVCTPIAAQEEPVAPEEAPPAETPAEAPAAEEPAAAAPEDAAPDDAAPVEEPAAPEAALCPEGFVLVEGQCLPADQAPAQ